MLNTGTLLNILKCSMLLGICLSFSLPAQADELSDLKVKMAKMEEEMHAMRERITGLEGKETTRYIVPPLPESEPLNALEDKVQFHGSVDLSYFDYETQGYRSGDSTFEVYEVYLAAQADITDDVMLYIEPRYEHGGDTIELRQGFIDWQLWDPVAIKAGKFYMPIGSYGKYYYNSIRKLVEYHYSMRVLSIAPWEETGVQLHGELPVPHTDEMRLNYAFAVTNGLDADYTQNSSSSVRNARQNRDNNSNKTLGGRIGFSPIKPLEVGFSYNFGRHDNTATHRLQFYDFDANLILGDFEFRGEYVRSHAGTVAATRRNYGYYVEGAYKVLKNFYSMRYLELVTAYDTVDAEQAVNDRFRIAADQRVHKISFGVNLSPRKHFLIKTEYGILIEDQPQIDNNFFAVQTVVDF